MNDAIEQRAANIGFISSFLIHAVVIMAMFMIAGNAIYGSEKLMTVVLDNGGFMTADGAPGGGSSTGRLAARQRGPGGGALPDVTQKKVKTFSKKSETPLRKSSAENPIKTEANPSTNEASDEDSAALPAPRNDIAPEAPFSRPSVAASPAENSDDMRLDQHGIGSHYGLAGEKYAAADARGYGFGNGSGDPGAGIQRTGAGSGWGGGSGKGGGADDSGSDNGGTAIEGRNARYIKEQFHYIREMITKNIAYPTIAKRMGWKGRVTVSFIISEGGYVESVRIVKGSGHKILDENAVSTIKGIQPFPKPPGRAEIVIPIEYRFG